MPSRGSLGRGRRAFTQHRDKRKVMHVHGPAIRRRYYVYRADD
jgi:hypothetical protein